MEVWKAGGNTRRWLALLISVDFHRACLQLITDGPPAVQEELDLISALCQLEDFGVNILPLQGTLLCVCVCVCVCVYNNNNIV
jgi:hypothetical protein